MGFEIYDGWLPEEFQFPPEFVAAVLADVDVLPWRFFARDNWYDARHWFDTFVKKYPQGTLIPFAYLYDPTGWSEEYPVVASLDAADNVVRIFASEIPNSSPWDNHSYADIDEWLESAQEEAHTYGSGFEPDQLEAWLGHFQSN